MPVLTETELRSGFATKIAGEIELPEGRKSGAMSVIKENLAVLVELAPPFDQVANEANERRQFEERLVELIDDLVSDLALPVEPGVQVRVAGEQAPGSDPIRLQLNCQPCRVTRVSPAWPERTSELFPTIAAAIVANRALFLSQELALRMAEELSARATTHVFDGLPAGQVRRLLASLLQRGFKVDRAVPNGIVPSAKDRLRRVCGCAGRSAPRL